MRHRSSHLEANATTEAIKRKRDTERNKTKEELFTERDGDGERGREKGWKGGRDSSGRRERSFQGLAHQPDP